MGVNELDPLGSWILLSEYAKGPVGFGSSHPDICHTASRRRGLGGIHSSESHLFPFSKPARCFQLPLSVPCLARMKGTATARAHGSDLTSLARLKPLETFKRGSPCPKPGGKDCFPRGKTVASNLFCPQCVICVHSRSEEGESGFLHQLLRAPVSSTRAQQRMKSSLTGKVTVL